MTELKRSYPYSRRLLLNGVYDLTEGRKRGLFLGNGRCMGIKVSSCLPFPEQRTPVLFGSGYIALRRDCPRQANCGR